MEPVPTQALLPAALTLATSFHVVFCKSLQEGGRCKTPFPFQEDRTQQRPAPRVPVQLLTKECAASSRVPRPRVPLCPGRQDRGSLRLYLHLHFPAEWRRKDKVSMIQVHLGNAELSGSSKGPSRSGSI